MSKHYVIIVSLITIIASEITSSKLLCAPEKISNRTMDTQTVQNSANQPSEQKNITRTPPSVPFLSIDEFGNGTFAGDINISSGSVTVGKHINFSNANSSNNDVVKVNNNPFIHNYGSSTNTFMGSNSGNLIATGAHNTAFGASAMSSIITGTSNTAFGTSALSSVTTGTNNTSIGSWALSNVVTGTNNAALGYYAGSAYTSWESGNITIGNTGTVREQNTIRIGDPTMQTSCFVAGVSGVTTNASDAIPVLISSTGQLGVTSSSRRYKKDITDMHATSAQLMALRPVTFKYKNHPDDAPVHYGLIAEEVAQVFPELVVYNKEGEPETVKYHDLPSLLLNEYQQQQKMLDGHDDKLDDHDEKFDDVNEKLDDHDEKLDDHHEKLDDVDVRLDQLKFQNKELTRLIEKLVSQDMLDQQLKEVLDKLEKIEKSIKRKH